ncbi:MAG: hypothetical protein EOP54_09880 [Sphingobacteriales bacterium]|nr:MAG: hypothetical protein EOP54_09880 [Sphingobacteriales bacterium]
MKLIHVFKHLAAAGMVLSVGYVTAQDLTGIINMDLPTGTANVNIPVTNFVMGGNTFGTSVSYNTKGVPVREFAGIVGAHWNLNIGGGIQRMVKGLPDEWYSAGSYTEGGNTSHPDYIPLLKYHQYRGRLIEGMETTAQKQDPGVYRDTESDEYIFSVGTIQFSFYIGRGGQVYCNTKDKYEVTILALDGTKYADMVLGAAPQHPVEGNTQLLQHFSFKVKDVQNGTTYFFSPSNLALYNVQPYFRSNYPLNINVSCEDADGIGIGGKNTKIFVGWKLDSVISAQNEQIQYSYEKFIIPPSFAKDEFWTKAKLDNPYTTAPGNYPASYNSTFKSPGTNPAYLYLVDTFYLVTRVDYPNNTRLELNYDKTKARLEYYSQTNNSTQTSFTPIWTNIPSYYFSKLDNIQFIDNGKARIYKFDYSYFHTPSAASQLEETDTHLGDEDDRYSLKLKGISVRDNHAGQYMPLYNFGYNDKKQRRHGSGLDYFGYFRGGSNAGVANFGREGHSLASDHSRTSDFTFMQYGILTNITNGRGGRMRLTYDAHRLQKVNSPLTDYPDDLPNYWKEIPADGSGYMIGDGLKVVTVEWTDDNNTQAGNLVQYYYENGQFFLPGAFYMQPTHFKELNANQVAGTYEYENQVNPSGLFRGANHSYGKVTETYASTGGSLHSVKETLFSNFSDISGTKAMVTGGGKKHVGFPYTQKGYLKSWEIGLPRTVKTYDSKQLLVKEEIVEYEYHLDTISARNAKVFDTNRVVTYYLKDRPYIYYSEDGCYHAPGYVVSQDPYQPYRGEALLKSVFTRTYVSDAAYKDDFVQYNYDSRKKLKTTLRRNSKSEMIETYNTYNYDISGINHPALNKMQAEGMTYLIAAEEWNNGASTATRNTASKLLKGTVFQFNLNGNAIYNKSILETALENPLSYSSYMSGGSGDVPGPVIAAYNGTAPAAFMETITEVQQRDTKGNPLETYLPQSNTYKSMLWELVSGNKLADVINARYSNIAYSGFEYGYGHNLGSASAFIMYIDEYGSLHLPSNFTEYVPVSTNLAGNYFCLLKSGNATAKRLYTEGLEPGIRYRATFWASSNTVPEFGIEGGTQFTLTEIAVKGQYKHYEVMFSPTVANQRIGLNAPAANVAIDELRIHPVAAGMTTYGYEKLNGKSYETDALGRITFYEYDGLGRLKLIRNQEGHIIQKMSYGTLVTE